MSIVKMKKIRLFAVRSQKDALLSELMHLGCVEFSEPESLVREPEVFSLVKKESSELERFRSEHTELQRALDFMDQYAPTKSSLFAVRPVVSAKKLLDESLLDERLELAKSIETLDGQIRRLSALETQQKNLIEALSVWTDYDVPLEITGTQYASIVLGGIPSTIDLDHADKALADAVPEASLLRVSTCEDQHHLVLVCLKDKLTDALEALRTFNFSVAGNKGLEDTAAENIERAEERLEAYASEKRELCDKITAEAPRREELKMAADLLATKIARAEAAGRLMGTERSVSLVGWVPAPEEKKLEAILSKYDCAWELMAPAPDEAEKVPIALKNNLLTKPLMMVTEMYSLPTYDGIDPNPLIAPFFTIFFGIMYADMGYGAILLILGILGRLLLKPRGTMAYAVALLRLCGITTIIFGFLFGSCFGDAIPVFTNMIGIERVELWNAIDPLKEPMQMLLLSLAIGVVQILVGMAIKAIMLIRDGKWLDAVFDVGSWWLLFAGIAVGALGGPWWVAIAGAAALVLTQGRNKPSIPGKIIGGLASLYDITGYLGDVLSYTRIMALLLASSVIASVVNVLGSLSGSIIVFIVVFLIGHAFNMGINIIGTFVHSARLQYLEFFGKFYKDGGRAFAPLKIKTKYYDVIKEEN